MIERVARRYVSSSVCRRMVASGNMVMPPTPIPETDRVVVFTAGSIDQDRAVLWQTDVASRLADTGALFFNPRRSDWDSSWVQSIDNAQFRGQVEWEIAGMERADVIAMYFDPAGKAPISLLELGLHAKSEKLIVYCPDGYWRKGNVDVTCSRYGVPVYEDYEEFLNAVRDRIVEVTR